MATSESTGTGRGVGPSVVGRLVREGSLRLAVGLAVAIAIPVAVLFYFQFRSIAALSQSSAVVLRQLSQETADGMAQSLQDALRAPYISVLLRVGQVQTEPLDLAAIAPTLKQGLQNEPFVTPFHLCSAHPPLHPPQI